MTPAFQQRRRINGASLAPRSAEQKPARKRSRVKSEPAPQAFYLEYRSLAFVQNANLLSKRTLYLEEKNYKFLVQ